MNKLTEVYKKIEEEFEKELVSGDYAQFLYGLIEMKDIIFLKRKLLSSQKSDILAVIEAVEKWAIKKINNNLAEKEDKNKYMRIGYNNNIADLLRFLKEAKEEINK